MSGERLSIVVPVYNERDSVADTLEALERAVKALLAKHDL